MGRYDDDDDDDDDDDNDDGDVRGMEKPFVSFRLF
jgi:hypothetical protein